MKKICVVWPTVRPEEFLKTFQVWRSRESKGGSVRYFIDVHATDIGVCEALYGLCRNLKCADSDIVVVGMDDVYPPADWDAVLLKEFESFDGALEVDDGGVRKDRPIYTSGILAYAALKKLNFILVHPDYYHNWSDNELYANLTELGLLKDVSKTNPAIFEHRHFCVGKRERDGVDAVLLLHYHEDEQTYHRRMKMPIQERLKVGA